MEEIIHCNECRHCFISNRSKTGYACEMWGHDDFADDTTLNGHCHRAESLYPSQIRDESWRFVEGNENAYSLNAYNLNAY